MALNLHGLVGRRATGATLVAAVAVTLVGLGVSIWCTATAHDSLAFEVLDCLAVLPFVGVGALVVAARPENRIGWLLLAGGVCWALGSAGTDLARHGIVIVPGSVPAVSAVVVVAAVFRSIGWFTLTLAVPVLFPDGRVAGPRWRWLYWALLIVLIASILDPVTDPQAGSMGLGHWRNPLAPSGDWRLISAIALFIHLPLTAVVTVAAVVQLVQRWRTGDAYRRQQLLLFACAAAVTIVAPPIGIWLYHSGWVFDLAAITLPIAIGFAVLARGLYDLRSATNRTLVWITLSAAVAVLFALVIALGGLVDVSASTPWLPWVAAGIVAICFAPMRDALQRSVNRLTFGRWSEPYGVLAALGQQLEASADVDRLLTDVVSELRSLGLRDVVITSGPAPDVAADVEVVPLSAYGATVGALSYRRPGSPLRPRDRQLLDDLAGHLGGVLYAQQLTVDLQRARERLVLAREEERRRLRRDLHDGLGPSLAGHLLRLDVIAGQVPSGSNVAALVDTLRSDLRDTVSEVRRVVEGLRPPALDELGLVGAVREAGTRLAAGSRLRVTVAAADLPSLPAAVEVAAYRIATEALTNAVKHSGARSCVVTLAVQEGQLLVEVRDDGAGLPAEAPQLHGHGMHTMRERAQELRGSLQLISADGAGTAVLAHLPVPETAGLSLAIA